MVVVTDDRESVIRAGKDLAPHLSAEELLEVPIVLVGTVDEIVAQVRRLREDHGISYLTVLQPYMGAFAPIMDALRGR